MKPYNIYEPSPYTTQIPNRVTTLMNPEKAQT